MTYTPKEGDRVRVITRQYGDAQLGVEGTVRLRPGYELPEWFDLELDDGRNYNRYQWPDVELLTGPW